MDLRRTAAQPTLDPSCELPLDRPFTAVLARAEGVRPHQLTWLVDHHYLRQPIKGVYVATQAGDSTALRVACLALVVPDDCVVVDRHAAWLLGAPMALRPGEHLRLEPIRVFCPPRGSRLRNGLADSGERELRPSDVTEIDGLAVTTPLRTAWDLGRVRYPDVALSGIDCMLRLGVDKEELLDGIAWFAGRRWVTTLRAVAPLGDGRAASPPESVMRLRWIEAGLPAPVPQLAVAIASGTAYLDLGEPELKMGSEYDGVEWHESPEQQAHDRERRAEVDDEGYLLEVFLGPDLFARTAAPEQRLRRLAARARARLGNRVIIL